MKKILCVLIMALASVTLAHAQQIAVVSPSGSTSTYNTLPEAIEGASEGSTIYLPGGSFKISDGVKITKKLTIMGIGYRANSENVDGATTISGNVCFNQGSDGSGLMGAYVTGYIYVGEDGGVDDILVRYCNVYRISIKNEQCTSTNINQTYVRDEVYCGKSCAVITNSIVARVSTMNGGTISHCVLKGRGTVGDYTVNAVNDSFISNNILGGDYQHLAYQNYRNQISHNLIPPHATFGEDYENYEEWTNVFVDPSYGISPLSDFNLKAPYSSGGNSGYGIYGGSGFNDSGFPPVPYITFKSIPEQTDAAGKLPIRVTVKAGVKK